jgi:hypothetical protein
VARHGILHRRDVVEPQDSAVDDERVVTDNDRRVTERTTDDLVVDRPTDRTVERPVERPAEVAARPGWVRVSAWATLGLIVSIVGLCATLTGLLAPEGFALGIIGFLISIAGLIGASRPGVTGHSLALLGVIFGGAAVVLAVLAMTGSFSWPNSSTNEITRWHTWLVAHWSWLGRWS